MKKIFLTLTITCALTVVSYAQGVSFGIKAGPNFANQRMERDGYTIDPGPRIGFHIGGFATIMFSESFGLQPELLYSSVGCKYDGGAVSKWDYITVPVNVRYQANRILNLHAGPQFGFLSGAKNVYSGDTDNIEATHGMEIAGAIGAGVDLPIGLGFTARYVFGLSTIMDYESDYNVRNNVLQVSVTYRFGRRD